MAAGVVNNVQQLLVKEEEVSTEQPECSSSLSHQETCVFKREEDVSTTLSFTPVHEKVRYEEDGQSLISSSIKDIEREADEIKCGGPEPDFNSILLSDHQRSPSSESDTDDSEDWRETSNSVKNRMVAVSEKKDDHKSLICSECGKKCRYKSELKTHMRIHTGERPYICSQCGKGCTNSGNLTKHMRIHTGEKPYICSQCGKCFTGSWHLKIHMRIHTGEILYLCSKCGKDFANSGNLKKHMRTHTGEKPYICSQCGTCFTNGGNLKRHMRTHTGEKPYRCFETCVFKREEEVSTTLSFTPVHEKVKNEEDEEESLISSSIKDIKTEADENKCGGPGPDLNLILLSDHQRSPSSESDTDDSEDWRETSDSRSTSISVNNRMVAVSEKKDDHKSLICSECGKKCSYKSDLKKHMRIHTGEKPYICSHCGKGFKCSSSKKKHVRTHTGEKPYICSQCDKGFTNGCNLKKHMLIHTGEKPHICSQCGKGFTDSWNLKIHMRIHTGEKPYICSQCGKGFTNSGNLKIHMRIHTGEKQYIGSQC